MYISLNEIDLALKKANVDIVDNECQENTNHISKDVLSYLENKWENIAQYEKENERLKKIGDELLKELGE